MAYLQEISPGIIIKQPQVVKSQFTPVGSVTLLDGQLSPTVFLTYNIASVQFLTIRYSLKRNTVVVKGILNVVHDGTSTSITDEFLNVGSAGVTFSANISGSDLRILYTTTNIGVDVVMKYNDLERWI